MPKKQNVLMDVEGMKLFLNDANYNHYKSLPKPQQEAIKQLMMLKILQNQ